MRRFITIGPGIVVLAAVMLVLAVSPAMIRRFDLARIAADVRLAQNTLSRDSSFIEQLNLATRSVADSTMPGVVHIQVRGARTRDGEEAPRRFSAPRASGAGWVYSEEGFLVTNAHVVDRAETIRVEFYDGRVRRARLIGSDPRTDIAVLKVDNTPGLIPLRRASGMPVHVGDRVFVFGSPFGIKFSMSQGIVSGLGRSEAASMVGMTTGYTNFIQTDAAMNPGNSGGPLVDALGRVVGMNTAIANNIDFSPNDRGPAGQSAGIGFAIPVETIDSVARQLINNSVVVRGYLGIMLDDYLPEYGARIGVEFEGAGALVTRVVDGHPASRAGLRQGDIITRVDGQTCRNSALLRSLVSPRQPGETLALTVWREGAIIELPVRIGGAYFASDEQGRDDLRYIEGSEGMTLEEISARISGRPGPARLD